MDFRHQIPGGSPSSSPSNHHHHHHHHHQTNNGDTATTTTANNDPMQSWWQSISIARSRIHLLSTLLPHFHSQMSSLADSDRPARSLLSSSAAYAALSSLLTSSAASGSGADPFCHWLYDTFFSSDPDLRLVVLSFIPLLSALYLSRIHSPSSPPPPSLAGFEAVLLAFYTSEIKSRAGKPIIVFIPDLSQPSLYHSPNPSSLKLNPSSQSPPPRPSIGVLSPPLEPQTAVKSTKRATIVGVALDCYYKHISQMPSFSKFDFCKFAADWAGQDCRCKLEFDHVTEIANISAGEIDNAVEEMRNLAMKDENSDNVVISGKARIPLPWELLQPVLRIVGHCLLAPLNPNDVRDAASTAVRCLYARALHELVPQAILAARSLIQLDKRARVMVAMSSTNAVGSNANTPTKAKKPEILLASK